MKSSTQLWLALLLLALSRLELKAADPVYDVSGGILGNLCRSSKSQSRSICPENFTGEKGKAGMATNGTGSYAARDLGTGWKISPSVVIKAKSTFTLGEIARARQHSAHLDDAHRKLAALNSALLLGWRNRAISGMPGRRFLRVRLGGVLPDQFAGGMCQPGQCVQLLLADAIPQVSQNHHGKYRRQRHGAVLSGGLHTVGTAGRCRLFPCPIPTRSAGQANWSLYDS